MKKIITDKKIGCLFIVPTIMTRPEYEISNVEHLAKIFPNDRILFISNIEDEDFSKYNPSLPNIEKYVSNKLYSISKAINTGLDKLLDEKYICFIQSDVRLSANVIERCRQICDDIGLNTGVVGTKAHSNFQRFNKLINGKFNDVTLYNALWADAVMFWSTDVLKRVGRFNEIYFGDKESQEYCYRAHDLGYNNYYFTRSKDMIYESNSISFPQKTKYDSNEFMDIVHKTQHQFKKKWIPWEETQHHRFR